MSTWWQVPWATEPCCWPLLSSFNRQLIVTTNTHHSLWPTNRFLFKQFLSFYFTSVLVCVPCVSGALEGWVADSPARWGWNPGPLQKEQRLGVLSCLSSPSILFCNTPPPLLTPPPHFFCFFLCRASFNLWGAYLLYRLVKAAFGVYLRRQCLILDGRHEPSDVF